MPLRIGDSPDLSRVSPSVRRQIEEAIARPREDGSRVLEPLRRPRGRRERPEQEAGRRLVDWIDGVELVAGLRPGLYFAHIPNGGARTATEGAILKGQGVRAGWPDYLLAIAIAPYHGMFLELKAEDGAKPTADQLEILARLEDAGFFVRVAWGFEQGRDALRKYLDPLWS